MSAFLGIDAGTTAIKAVLFDLDGQPLASAAKEYSLDTPSPAVVELDAEVYWEACVRAVRDTLQQSRIHPQDVLALAISSQGETIVPVDNRGSPLRPAIVWLDSRATEEASEIAACFSPKEVFAVTGQPQVTPGWPACKILWLRRHEPRIFEQTAKFLLLEDYLLHRLTGQYVTERALQTSSLLLDIRNGSWWRPMLPILGIEEHHLCRLVNPGEVVGHLTTDGAEACGLSSQTRVVTGALDQVAGAVGAGNISAGLVSETTGGALAICATLDRPLFDPQARVPCHYHAQENTYCLLPWAQTAGMALRWFRDTFCLEESSAACEAGVDSYYPLTEGAALVPAGSEGLTVLPHLSGAACPEFNPHARAVFFGATLSHGKPHFVRAIMESVAYMLKRNLDIVEELGGSVSEVRSLGGGARSDLWLQIKANVLQKPVRRVAAPEAACLGVAMLASVAVGVYPDLGEANRHMVQLGQTVWPDPDSRSVYLEGYHRYLELYDRLTPMFRP